METLGSEDFSDADQEELKEMLDSISSQLEVSLLDNSLESDEEDIGAKYKEIVSLLTEKERELQAAVGIARMLLQKNEDLRNEEEETRVRESDRRISLQNEVQILEERLEEAEKNYLKLHTEMVHSEDHANQLQVENHQLQKELSKLKALSEEKADLAQEHNSQLHQLKDQHSSALKQLSKENKDLEAQLEKLEESLRQSEATNDSLKNQVKKLETEQTKLVEQNNSLKNQVEELNSELESMQKSLDDTSKMYALANTRAEHLQEELTIAEQRSLKTKSKTPRHQSFSLKTELASLDEDSFLDEDKIFLNKNKKRLEVEGPIEHCYFRRNETNFNQFADKQYFYFAGEAVKMNSPLLKKEKNLPFEELYKKALKDQVPFHKWHTWIESQLYSTHMQVFCKNEIKRRFERSKKRINELK